MGAERKKEGEKKFDAAKKVCEVLCWKLATSLRCEILKVRSEGNSGRGGREEFKKQRKKSKGAGAGNIVSGQTRPNLDAF